MVPGGNTLLSVATCYLVAGFCFLNKGLMLIYAKALVPLPCSCGYLLHSPSQSEQLLTLSPMPKA